MWRAYSTRGLRAHLRPEYRLTGSHCAYCGVELCICLTGGSGKKRPDNLLTVDHKQATARGGADAAPNLALCCLKCNQAKGDRPADRFRPPQKAA